MKLPVYVTKDEVKRVCKEIGIRDWTQLKEAEITKNEALKILKIVNTKKMNIPLGDFKKGLEVELEHGTRYSDANVTNNHPLLTGMIVLAHLKETMDYYKRIDVAEYEGDLLKAILAKNFKKADAKYKMFIEAQKALFNTVSDQLKKTKK